MKELQRFRQFLNEDQMKNLAKLLRDEADQPDNKVGKDIMLKYAAQAEKTDVKDIKSLLGKLEDELIAKHPDTFSGEDDIVGSFLSVSKNYIGEGMSLQEGTWSVGSPQSRDKLAQMLQNVQIKNDSVEGMLQALEIAKDYAYKVAGDDNVFDYLDAATAELKKGEEGFDPDHLSDHITDAILAVSKLQENDSVLDEIIGEEKESLTKQIMKKYPKKYKDEQAVKDAAKELMKNPKYKAKQGIGPVLQALLKGK